jgi:hypothetical protein
MARRRYPPFQKTKGKERDMRIYPLVSLPQPTLARPRSAASSRPKLEHRHDYT